ncbi:putative carbohydrate-binding X8 domain-containing protein, plant [Dioscorea sansibarensis]
MAFLVFLVFMLAMSGGSDATWCTCKTDQPTTSQQKALDYACGAGADCTPILQNGACYNPNTVNAHCSYAVNSYYQRKGQAQGSCDFAGAAQVTQTDPSTGNGCTFPATPSAAGTSGTTTTANSTSGTTPSTTFTPTGSTGTGVIGGSLGPSGTSFTSPDGSNGGKTLKVHHSITIMLPFLLLLLLRL